MWIIYEVPACQLSKYILVTMLNYKSFYYLLNKKINGQALFRNINANFYRSFCGAGNYKFLPEILLCGYYEG